LLITIGIALTGLTRTQLKYGTGLLILSLLYTLLNQTLSRRFFPKEICVSFIYAGGVIVFLLPHDPHWISVGSFALLCLANCLAIGAQEMQIDSALEVSSLSHWHPWLTGFVELACALSLCFSARSQAWPIALALAMLWIIQYHRQRLSIEVFRVFADSTLLIAPIAFLLLAI
jgi:hypothetical protein